jgi:hypothetical protein
MANLKNITELPVAESADGLNLIVNDNGSAKQIAASAVGAQADWAVTDENSPAFIKNKPEVVQADWNQNNSSAQDYVKNRTHWVEEEVVLERRTIEGFADMGGGYGVLLSYTINIPDGEMTVYWDGVEYNCVASNGFVGNTLFMGSGVDNGMPFVILQEANGGVSGIAVVDGSTATSHTVGIVKKTYHKLDSKYLPEEELDLDIVITQVQDAEGNNANLTWVINSINTFENIKNKIFNGIHPNCKCQFKGCSPTEDTVVLIESYNSMNTFWGIEGEEVIGFRAIGFNCEPFVVLASDNTIVHVEI